MKEEWKQKEGFSKYLISNDGRVLSLDYKHKGIVEELKQSYGYSSSGKKYCRVALYDDNGKKHFLFVHRLVAELFIPNPNNYPCVNHIDENPSNNIVSNLEWCTYYYNNTYKDRHKNIQGRNGRNIAQCDLNGNILYIYNSKTTASKETKTSKYSITRCANGIIDSVDGFTWRWIDETTENV
jgi:hypothetical protein